MFETVTLIILRQITIPSTGFVSSNFSIELGHFYDHIHNAVLREKKYRKHKLDSRFC